MTETNNIKAIRRARRGARSMLRMFPDEEAEKSGGWIYEGEGAVKS